MDIVLIDDDEIYLFLAKKILSKWEGAGQIYAFSNSVEAVEWLRNNSNISRGCVVLLDLNMPAFDGFQVLEKIAEFEHNPYKVIIVSSTSLHTDIDKTKRFHFVKGFISKPLELNKLIEIIL